jgi:two-component system phosphate regulon sensor histidine kinase PhoR
MAPSILNRRRAVLAFAPGVLLAASFSAAGLVDPAAAALIAFASGAGCWWLTRSGSRHPVDADRPPPVPETEVSQAFLERLPDPVIVVNRSREIVAVNQPAREAFGIGLLGRDLALSLRHPDILAAFETIIAGAPSVTREVTLPIPAPRTFTLFASDMPNPDDHRTSRVVLVLRDETRAKRAERSRADFVANASHELRSPLAALIGFIETLRGPASDDAAARDRFLGIMQAESLRMARLVDDLLSLSRVEMNEHVPPRERVDVHRLLAAVADTLAIRADQRQMHLALDVGEDLPQVTGDRDQLAQVFHNLIGNSIKYGREGTEINIAGHAVHRSPELHGGGVAISIVDHGEGIEAIHLPRLTERFYRADKGRSRKLGGTGLGLAIVKHIVNRHRGRLTIESTVGKGTTVTVLLPAADRGASGSDETAQSAESGDTRPAVTKV